MSEVKVNSNLEIKVTDARNRVIVIKKPNLLAVTNYKIAMGKDREALQEETYILPWVVSIDGVAIVAPTALIDVKNLIQILDFDGYNAVALEILNQVKIENENEALEPLEKKAD